MSKPAILVLLTVAAVATGASAYALAGLIPAGADIISLRLIDDDVGAGDRYALVCDRNYVITHLNIVAQGTLTDETVSISISEYPVMDDKVIDTPFLGVDLMEGTFAGTPVGYDELQMDAGEGFEVTINMPTDDGDEVVSLFASGLRPGGATCTFEEYRGSG